MRIHRGLHLAILEGGMSLHLLPPRPKIGIYEPFIPKAEDPNHSANTEACFEAPRRQTCVSFQLLHSDSVMDFELENVPPIPKKIKRPGWDLCSEFQPSCTGPYPRLQYQVRPRVLPGRGRVHTVGTFFFF